ncbi:MAG: mechanosensitive ion channel domain-containing protein [Hyphomicrobiales bacterium]
MGNFLKTIAALIVFCALAAQTALAVGEKELRALEGFTTRLEEVKKSLARPDLSDEQLDQLRGRLELIRTEALTVVGKLTPNLENARDRLAQLGDAPKEGEEPPDLAQQRETLTNDVNEYLSVQKRLEVLAVTASQLSSKAANIQRQHFFNRIFETSYSIFNLKLWSNGREGFVSFVVSSWRIIGAWLNDIRNAAGFAGWLGLALLILVAGAAGQVLRAFLSRIVGPNIQVAEPATLSRLWRVFRGLLINVVSYCLAFAIVGITLESFDQLPDKMRVVLVSVLFAGIFLISVRSLTRGVLAKNWREWRLAAVTDSQAARLKRAIDFGAFVVAINVFLTSMSAVVFAPVSAAILVSAIITVLLGGCLFSALATVKAGSNTLADEETRPAARRGSFKWLGKLRLPLWIIGAFSLLCLVFGYISLGHFIMTQLAFSGTLIAILYLAHHLIDELVITGLQPGWAAGDFLRLNLGLQDKTIDRIGLVTGSVTDLLLVFIGIPLLISQIALTRVDLQSWLVTAFYGFEVGGVHISLGKILIAILAFIAGLVLTRVITSWLDNRVLSRAQLNRGVRDSIRTAAGWFGYVVAAVLALTFVGANFSNIAIIAGALGVGIGFGLQSIVNNFVSGLILLAERPVKVGDWIKVTGGEGYVKKIKIRSTEIETFDKCSIIVPNSSLISEPVQNWTHGDTIGRVRVPVGVAYDTDPDHLRDVVYACATAHEQVLAFPQPSVVFFGFGASSLDFELRCFIPDVDYTLSVASDLRFSIFRALKENGIEIPFPQQDLHIKDARALKDALVDDDDDEKSPPQRPARKNS